MQSPMAGVSKSEDRGRLTKTCTVAVVLALGNSRLVSVE
jgi:hypothetical protein